MLVKRVFQPIFDHRAKGHWLILQLSRDCSYCHFCRLTALDHWICLLLRVRTLGCGGGCKGLACTWRGGRMPYHLECVLALPSIDIFTSASFNACIHSKPVNWLALFGNGFFQSFYAKISFHTIGYPSHNPKQQ